MTSLRLDRLFQVVVVLGGASGLGACDGDGTTSRDRIIDGPPSSLDGEAGVGTDDGGNPLAPCFCDSQACCDHATNPPQLQVGFVCCWATTCD